MNKRFLVIAIAVLAIAGLGILLINEYTDPKHDNRAGLTETELAEASRKHYGEAPSSAPAPPPMDPARQVRLAIGSLGLASDEQNRQLGDLIVAELTGARGLDLVERQDLEVALREMQLSLSGLVRGPDAVRVGKLVRADWFLLGSSVSLNGTNYIVVRVVDGRTGVLREAGAFASGTAQTLLASELAGFVRQSRQNAAEAKAGVYLSVGTFEDFSLNNRHADLPVQLRSYLTASYQRSKVTLLEREFANTLLKEVQLGLAGMTDESSTNAPVMQSGYWMVDGYYQSYEDSGLEVEAVVFIRRMFGVKRQFTLRDKPGEPLFRRVKEALDGEMQRDQAAVRLSRASELRAQLASGKAIFHAGSYMRPDVDLVGLSTEFVGRGFSDNEIARWRRNIEEAIRAFETVLLLDPSHREARMYLAACFRHFFIGRTDEALNLYRELIEAGINDSWSTLAGKALEQSFRRASPEEKLRWFEAANRTHPHEFYQSQIKTLENQIARDRRESSEPEQVAEEKLFESIAGWEQAARKGVWAVDFSSMGFRDFVEAFGTNEVRAAERLAALLPRLQAASSNLSPYLIAGVLTYQVQTNTPLVTQFEQSLEEAASHPEKLFGAKHYFSMVSDEVHDWAAEKRLYPLAAQAKLVRERVAQQKVADPLNDQDKMGLAFSYLGAEAWQKALEIFQSYSNRPVQRGFSGETKRPFMPVLTGKQANFCRQKLGLPVQTDPREFEMGTNCLCLHGPSALLTDGGGMWVGTGDQLLRLDYDLRTNLVVTLPTDGGAPITALLTAVSNLWIGTSGAGLIEFDKTSRQCRRLTVKDGLMMDSISSLHLAGNTLWIGYGNNEGGGLGRVDLSTRAIKSFTLSLAGGTEVQRNPVGNMAREASDKPPHRLILGLASGPGEEICFSTEFHPLRRYHPKDNSWSASPVWSGNGMVGEPKRLFVTSGGAGKALGVTVWDFEGDKVWSFKEAKGLPWEQAGTLTLDGQNLWVGGFGFVALADANTGDVRKFAYVPAESVDQIQIGGGYVWAVFDRHLHRASLP
jgi:tetratricopeptide (TPR) repeat protein